MTTFPSWRSYENFQSAVRRQLRYFRTPEIDQFLETVLATSQDRQAYLDQGKILWRSQLGHDWREEGEGDAAFKVPCAYSPSRMTPLRDRACEGRVNPRGIPCLYLADRKDTAIAEVRPWVGSYVSVAQFKVVRTLRIIDCARSHDRKGTPLFFGKGEDGVWGFREPDPVEREKAVWTYIDRAFSEPMTRSDDIAHYVPTQIIAELFKSKGFDGIGYASNFGDGFNLAIFDLDAAELLNCGLNRVDRVKLRSSQQDNPYFVRKSDQS